MKTTRTVMGMPVSVEVVADGGRAGAAIERAFEWFHEVDRTFSTYKADSEISRINRGELLRAAAPVEVRAVLTECDKMRTRTSGFFDMRRPDGLIDPSGYVKGWAVDRAARLVEEAGFGDYCVEAGGDLQTGGHNPDGEKWRVGVRNPLKPSEIIKILHVSGQAVATSGTYERGHHIYDPHSGQAVSSVASVTVVGPRITWADVAATAAFAMGPESAHWLARQPGLEAYVIGHDAVATFTDGLDKYLSDEPA